MPVTIVVPQLGESVVEGTIGKWLKKVGDPIAKDEPIVEIITDKINIELPAPAAGTLGQIGIAEGVVAQVGETLGLILAPGESLGAAAPKPSAPSPPAPAAPAPASGGAAAPRPAPAAPAPTQAPATMPAYGGGASASATAMAAPPSSDGMRLSPAVRKLAREHQVDVSQIRGSGAGGRVTRDDVLTYIEARKVAAAAGVASPAWTPAAAGAPASAPSAPKKAIPAPAFAAAGTREVEVQPLTNLRKKIAENMVRSRHTAAHCAVTDEVDMTALVDLRRRLKEKVRADYGLNLTYMPFIMKAVVRGLKEHPVLNASMTETEAHYKKFYNIGVAVHRDQGLIVPIVRDADRKTLLQLAADIDDLGARARADRLTLDDIQGGTFTITNAGMFGATASVPVINYPEVGILGVHLIEERPVVRDHRIVVRWMMTLVLSFDHRLVDGTPAVQFLHRVKELLEDPESWLLGFDLMNAATPVYDLGRVPYRKALAFQHRAVEMRARGESPDVLYIVEHEPVLTVGRAGHSENLRAGDAELARAGIEVVPVERGGDVTYHGPGQIVGYPIVDLTGLPGGRDLHRYLRDLEEAMIACLARFGLDAARRPPYTGVWMGDRKVAAIGVAVRHWIAFHGFALNLDPNMSHFDLIHPCGIRDLGVCSMAGLLGSAPPRETVIARLADAFSHVWERPFLYSEAPASGPDATSVPETSHA